VAKRQKNHQVRASFHYLVKSIQNGDDPDDAVEEGFTDEEFQRVIARISDLTPLDEADENVIQLIKTGKNLPFNHYEILDGAVHFGDFEGAYYGQKYRNNRLGVISAESLNLRNFHYLITKLRDGKILVGITYHGQFGDYDGIKSCLSHILHGNYRVASKTLRSVSTEIGRGHPISLKLAYRKANNRPERKALFGTSGVFAIKNSEYGEDFEDRVNEVANRMRGTAAERKRVLAEVVNAGSLLELDDDDIIGCSVLVREDRSQRTVYFLGDNNFSTKFPLQVDVDGDGVADRDQVKMEMIRIMRERIIPLRV